MRISINDILEFHKLRTQCHIDCVNYFAGLLGYHFSEHDNDKMKEPMRTGYAYKNYAEYHKHFNFLQQYKDLFNVAWNTHHQTNSHHIENYTDVTQISKICLIEMVCDWFSACSEQLLLNKNEYSCVRDWFDNTMLNLSWTDTQLQTIYQAIDYIEKHADFSCVNHIWNCVITKSDL